MRISDWSSDVCSSDLVGQRASIVDLRDQILELGIISRDCEIAAPHRAALDADLIGGAAFVAEQYLYRARSAGIGQARVETAGAVAAADLAIGENIWSRFVRKRRIVGGLVDRKSTRL